MSRLERITSDPQICHGQRVVRGLRYPVPTLLRLMASGMTAGEILEDYPDLERDDLLAALEYGALPSGGLTAAANPGDDSGTTPEGGAP
jgi:uncharacterized protein (DUF433 family)